MLLYESRVKIPLYKHKIGGESWMSQLMEADNEKYPYNFLGYLQVAISS
jgi:hypothetical protein